MNRRHDFSITQLADCRLLAAAERELNINGYISAAIISPQ
jgi:hypothetical protein